MPRASPCWRLWYWRSAHRHRRKAARRVTRKSFLALPAVPGDGDRGAQRGTSRTIYDTRTARVLRAPVSTGQTGCGTPAGIYSVLEKSREHYPASMMMPRCPSCSASAVGNCAARGTIAGPSGLARLHPTAGWFCRALVRKRQAWHARRHRARRHAAIFHRPPRVVQAGSHCLGYGHAGENFLDHARADRYEFGRGGGRWHSSQAADVALDRRRQEGRGDAAAKTAEDARHAVVSTNGGGKGRQGLAHGRSGKAQGRRPSCKTLKARSPATRSASPTIARRSWRRPRERRRPSCRSASPPRCGPGGG